MSAAADAVVGPDRAGTFAGYGVDLRVALSPGAADASDGLPLCALITGWVRGQVDPQARAEVRVYSDGYGADAALDAAGGCAPRSTRRPTRSGSSSSPTARTP